MFRCVLQYVYIGDVIFENSVSLDIYYIQHML